MRVKFKDIAAQFASMVSFYFALFFVLVPGLIMCVEESCPVEMFGIAILVTALIVIVLSLISISAIYYAKLLT